MENKKEILIVTPTYNRKKLLERLYNSLLAQSNHEFCWIIIDDGSTDDTGKYINSIMIEEKINIKYIYQENSGKCKAINRVFSEINDATLYVIVDSDDYLLENAVEILHSYLDKYREKSEVGGFFFRYMIQTGEVIGDENRLPNSDCILNRYEYNYNYQQHDGCIVYFGKVIKKYKYPEFIKEKYIGPTVIQMDMAKEFKIVFSPEIIGIAEYQADGITNSGRRLRIKNPLGMIYYSGLLQTKDNRIIVRIKNYIGAQTYAIISKKNKIELKSLNLDRFLVKWAYIPGLILSKYWYFKYMREYIDE